MPAAALMWAWGAGTDGQLGTGVLEDQHLPQPLALTLSCRAKGDAVTSHEEHSETGHEQSASFACSLVSPETVSAGPSDTVTVSQLACGSAHCIALTGSGRVLTWGRGTQGQLGHSKPLNCLKPKLLKFLEQFTVSYISAGWSHSGFVTDTGILFTCGDGSFGQLGHGDCLSSYCPTEVVYFGGMHVEQVACGMRHTLVLLKGQLVSSVYGFGSGRHGQLGMKLCGTNRLESLPRIISGFENESISIISANGDHSAALTFDGQLYIWGRSFCARMSDYLPHKLASHLKFSQIALGWNHALVLTVILDDREIYMLGGKHHGKLSDPKKCEDKQKTTTDTNQHDNLDVSGAKMLVRVPGLDGKTIVHIAAGAEHSAIVTEKGAIMTWGWGEHGQLGLGDAFDLTIPRVVDVSRDGGISAPCMFRIYCGSGFTFAVPFQD